MLFAKLLAWVAIVPLLTPSGMCWCECVPHQSEVPEAPESLCQNGCCGHEPAAEPSPLCGFMPTPAQSNHECPFTLRDSERARETPSPLQDGSIAAVFMPSSDEQISTADRVAKAHFISTRGDPPRYLAFCTLLN
jgi:hypothetical protein